MNPVELEKLKALIGPEAWAELVKSATMVSGMLIAEAFRSFSLVLSASAMKLSAEIVANK